MSCPFVTALLEAFPDATFYKNTSNTCALVVLVPLPWGHGRHLIGDYSFWESTGANGRNFLGVFTSTGCNTSVYKQLTPEQAVKVRLEWLHKRGLSHG